MKTLFCLLFFIWVCLSSCSTYRLTEMSHHYSIISHVTPKMHKYQFKIQMYLKAHVMQSSVLFLTDSMTSTHSWPQQGWAILQVLLVVSFSQADEQVCRQMGDPENPQLSQDGNMVLGGIFSFYSSWKDRMDTYLHKPLPLQCTRYVKY